MAAESVRALAADWVRSRDPERYLVSLFASEAARPRLLALYAFDIELARIREQVSEPLLGRIRLEWWRETIGGIYDGAAPPAGLAEALAATIRESALPLDAFERMLDARERELADEPPASFADLEAYLDGAKGALAELSLRALGSGDGGPREALSAIALGSGLIGIVRALPALKPRSALLLPADSMARHGADPGAARRREFTRAFGLVIEELLDRAGRHLDRAREIVPRPDRALLPLFLASVIARSHLTAIQRAEFNPYAVNFERGAFMRTLRVGLSALTRRV